MLNAFQLQVLRHRQALASFARRRARKTKKKWALKYDELYYNGRVFVFDEEFGTKPGNRTHARKSL